MARGAGRGRGRSGTANDRQRRPPFPPQAAPPSERLLRGNETRNAAHHGSGNQRNALHTSSLPTGASINSAATRIQPSGARPAPHVLAAAPQSSFSAADKAVMEPPQRRMLTRALLKNSSLFSSEPPVAAGTSLLNPNNNNNTSSGAGGEGCDEAATDVSSPRTQVLVGGLLHCICSEYLVSRREALLQCSQCRDWYHAACVGVEPLEHRQLLRSSRGFCCPRCVAARAAHVTGQHGPVVPSSAFGEVAQRQPVTRPKMLRLAEVPDHPPANAPLLRELLSAAERVANASGYDVLYLPRDALSDAQRQQCIDCCTEAIQQATFSPEYPPYCVREVCTRLHPYVQGTVLRARASGTISAMVLSTGMDIYGNLKSTITHLKGALHRGHVPAADVTPFMLQCLNIADVSDVVHITISATHAQHQRRGLARLLMTMELLRWALRGRTRAYLNMAIEKKLVDDGSRVQLAAPPASRRLYEGFGFADIYRRVDHETGEERWTSKEVDAGRVMVSLNFAPRLLEVASAVVSPREPAAAPTAGIADGARADHTAPRKRQASVEADPRHPRRRTA